MNKCPDCGSLKLKLVENELMCKDCGAVLDEGLFSGSRIV